MQVRNMFSTIDTHVAGEAFRIVIQSPILLHGATIQENNEQLQHHFQREKKVLLNEPRGHRGMNGCLILPSTMAHYQLLFFHHPSTMGFKYEGIAASLTGLLETGTINQTEDDQYRVETMNGIITMKADYQAGQVLSVTVENMDANVIESNNTYKKVTVDHERHYYIYDLPKQISGLTMSNLQAITDWGKQAITQLNEEGSMYEGVILMERHPHLLSKVTTVTFNKDGFIQRAPGMDSTIAVFMAKDPTDISSLENESIFRSSISATKVNKALGRFTLQCRPFITGTHEFFLDHHDPLQEGFLLE